MAITKIAAGTTGANASQQLFDNDNEASEVRDYVAGQTYTKNQKAVYNGVLFRVRPAKASTTQVPSELPTSDWEALGSGNSAWQVKKTKVDILKILTWDLGFRIQTDGRSAVADSAWQTSKFREVKAGQVVTIYLRGLSAQVMAIFSNSDSFAGFQAIVANHVAGGNQGNQKATYVVAANGFMAFSYIRGYAGTDLYITVEDAAGIAFTANAQYLSDQDDALLKKWDAKTGYESIKDSLRWTNGQYINGAVLAGSAGWQYSETHPVKAGDLIEMNLRGDGGRMMGGFYSADRLDSFVASLGAFVTIVGGFPLYNTRKLFVAPSDGFVAFNNRYLDYAKTDLYIKVYREGMVKNISAQQLFDLIPANPDDVPKSRFVYIDRPKYAELHLTGILPTDANVLQERATTPGTVKIKVDGRTVFSANRLLQIQGNGSALLAKKGYTLDLFSFAGDSLKLKIGNMIAADSWHLKAYYTDRTHSRDVGSGRMWRDMIGTQTYPLSKVNNKVFALLTNPKENDAYTADAQYYTDGVPMGMYLEGVFQGLYTMRIKKTRENYALDNSNMDHIFLDSATYTAYLKEAFNPGDWEIKSPKMDGYVDQGGVPDAAVLAKINRLFGFTSTLNTSYATYADFIVLEHWIAWIIFSEVVSNRDTDGNNMNLFTWDGVHWTIVPYDMDLIMGLNPWNPPGTYKIDATRPQFDINHDIWGVFKTRFAAQIRAEYTRLRNIGFLTTTNLMKYYVHQIDSVPRKVYQDDRAIWPLIFENGEPTIEQIAVFLNSKIAYLDTQWRI